MKGAMVMLVVAVLGWTAAAQAQEGAQSCYVEQNQAVEAVASQPGSGARFAVVDGQLGAWDALTDSYQLHGAPGALKGVTGMAFDPRTGMLYGVRADAWLVIDIHSGQPVKEAFGQGRSAMEAVGLAFGEHLGDIAIDPADGQLYAAVLGGQRGRLVRLGRLTGKMADVGTFESGVEITSMSMDSAGQLWGAASTEGQLYAIEKDTARVRWAMEAAFGASDRNAPVSCLCAGLESCQMDADADGLSNAREVALGTNPFDADTDHDGYDDITETEGGRFVDVNDNDVPDAIEPQRRLRSARR